MNSNFDSNSIGRNIYIGSNYDDILIDNCAFNNASLYISSYGKVDITNSSFVNCEKRAIESNNGETNILDCKFENSTQTSVKLSGGYDYNIINCGFENCYSNSSAPCIYLSSGSIFLENNAVVNCNSKDKGNYVYSEGDILSHVNIIVMNNETYELVSFGANLNAKILDDNGNDIVLDSLGFYLNDEFATSASFVGNVAKVPYKALLDGTYVVSAKSYSVSNNTIKTATITVTPLMEKELYVATTGSDESGDGTEANPYATLKKAIDEAVAYNNTIHVADGAYVIDTALDIDTNTAILNIVGSGENTVFDMANESTFISSLSAKSIVELKDLTLANGKSSDNVKGGFITSAGNLTLNNVNLINATAVNGGAIRSNGILTVADSYFENTVASSRAGAIYGQGSLWVLDCNFNKTSAANAGAIYSQNYLYIKNNTFIDTSADMGKNILLMGSVDGGIVLTVMDNETWNIDSSSVTFNATVTDDNNNPIYLSNMPITFYLDGIQVASGFMSGETFTTTANLKLNGVHVASATLGNSKEFTVKTATLNFTNPSVLADVYVSNAGSDLTGDGSRENPFATIEKALTVVPSINGAITVLDEIPISNIIAISDLNNLTIKGENNAKLNASGANQLMTIASSASVNLVDLGLAGSYFDENTPVANQGGIRNNGILNVINCTFEEDNYYISTWEFWDNIGGAAIYNNGGVLTIIDSTFKNNIPNGAYGTNYGGLIYSTKNLTIINSSFIDTKIAQNSNYGNYYGGLIYSTGTALLDGVKFINTSFSARDGQLYGLVYSTNDLTVNNSCFDSNYYNNIRYGSASGLAIYSTRNIVIDNSNFTNNYVRDQSGIAGQSVVYLTGTKNIISNSRFESNEIGKTVYASGTTSIDTCTFKDNKGGSGSNGYGIGVYVASGTTNITNSIFKGNTASMGTVYSNFATTYLSGNTFDSNEVQTGTIYVYGGNVYISDNTIKSNYASVEGGVLYANMGNLYLYDDNTIRGNTATVADYISISQNTKITGSTYTLVFSDNGTYFTEGNYFDVNVTFFDAKNNPIYGASVTFYLNETPISTARVNASGVATARVTSNNKGEYILTGESSNILNSEDCIIKTATLTFEPIHEIIAYVDGALGSDTDGDGSEGNPYLTISKAVGEASKAIDGTVYIQPGTYAGDLNVNLNAVIADGSSLRIIGLGDEDDDVIIDLENAEGNYFINESSQSESRDAKFLIQNIVIINSNIEDGAVIESSGSEVVLNELLFENNSAALIKVVDSTFDGEKILVINSTSTYLFRLSNSQFELDEIIILNSNISMAIYSYGSEIDNHISDIVIVNNEINSLIFGYYNPNDSAANGFVIENAIIENNEFSGNFELDNLNLSNSVIFNNTMGGFFNSRYATLENNWWGSNTNPNKLLGTDFIKNWIVVEVTSNASEIVVGDDVKFNIRFLLHDGSALTEEIAPRFVKAISENANFTYDEVYTESNQATIFATANSEGTIEIVIDNQSFEFPIVGKKTVIDASEEIDVDYGEECIIAMNLSTEDVIIAGADVSIIINDVPYNGTTDDEGVALIDIGKLDAGSYLLEYRFDGDEIYEGSSSFGLLNVNKANPVLSIEVENIKYTETANIAISLMGVNGEKLNATVLVFVNNKEESVEIKDGEGSLAIADILDEGSYLVVAYYDGSDNYNSALETENFTVSAIDTSITIELDSDTIEYGEDSIVTIELLDEFGNGLNAIVTLTVGDFTYIVEVIDGEASYALYDLEGGEYLITVEFEDATNYFGDEDSALLTVEPADDTQLDVAVDGKNIEITLTDENGYPLDGMVNVTIDGETEEMEIEIGRLVIEGLDEGDHTVEVSFLGDNDYGPASVEKEITILPDPVVPVSANATIELAVVGDYVEVTLKDLDGNPIAGAELEADLNNLLLSTVTTDDDGKALVDLYGEPNFNFTVTVVYTDDLGSSVSASLNNIYVENETTVIIYENVTVPVTANGSMSVEASEDAITATLTDSDGNPVANATVAAVIGGEQTNLTTDKDGKLTVPISENATVELTYTDTNGASVSYTAKVVTKEVEIEVPVTANGTMSVETTDDAITATLTDSDGNPLANATVTAVIDGVETNFTTDENGKLTVPVSENATVELSYTDANGASVTYTTKVVTNEVEIPVPVTVNGTIALATEDGKSIIATLTDSDGKAIADAELTISVNGQESTVKTDANGKATVDVEGNTTVVATYKDANNLTATGYMNLVVIVNETIINETIIVIPNRTETVIDYQNMTTTVVASADGRIGEYFTVVLRDDKGNALADKPIKIGFNGKVYDRVTDENGSAKLQINLGYKGTYTFAIGFLGDDNYTGAFEVAKITVKLQTPKLSTSSKTYKASAKTKALTATLKTVNGNGISNKKVSFTVNGKTYSGTTNDKGVATVKVSLSTKGTYSFTAKFAGDDQFAKVTANGKLTIK